MKAKLHRENLFRALQLTTKVVNPKPLIPLFANVLLEVEEDNARITGTNLEVTIRYNIKEVEGESFSTAVPAKLFFDLVSNLRDGSLNLKYDTSVQSLAVSTKSNKNNIKCVNSDDFPPIEVISKKKISVNSTVFKKAINRVSFASKVDGESVLNGVLLTIEDGKLILFATDSFHLSYEEIPLKKSDMKMYAIVRATNLDMLSKVLEEEETLHISESDNQLRMSCGSLEMTVQKMSGKYPDYKMLVPGNPSTSILISTTALFQACKQLELFTDLAAKLSVQGMLINASARSKERGNSDIQLVANITGKPIDIGINVVYVKQMLSVCATEEVSISLEDARKPIVFRMKDVDTFYHIIMPFALDSLE